LFGEGFYPHPHAAIEATLPLGTVGVEPKANEKGEREVWLDDGALNRLRLMRGPGESYSDVILRLVEIEVQRQPRGHGSRLSSPDIGSGYLILQNIKLAI
jgi:hypothetical protein